MSARPASLDRVTRVALFGARFRDAATRKPVADGLDVRLYRPEYPQAVVHAFPTRGGAFAVLRLPAMPRWDLGEGDDAFWTAAQAGARDFVVEVRDRHARFHDFSFRASLPRRHLFAPSSRAAAASGAADSVPLFARASRAAPPSTAAVHAELRDESGDNPLAHALLAIESDGVEVGLGVAGADGRVVAMFPYPAPVRPPPPPPGTSPPPHDPFGWDVAIKVYHQPPASPPPVRVSSLPDIEEILKQRDLAPSRPLGRLAPETPLPAQRLALGRELAVKTSDSQRSALHVKPPL